MRKLPIAILATAVAALATVEIPFIPQGPNGMVTAIAHQDLRLIAAGHFSGADDVPALGIAAWDGAQWHPLGKGLRKAGLPKRVSALHVDGERIYACGDFDSAGTVAAAGKAVWDGTRWSALGTETGDCDALATWKGKPIALNPFETGSSGLMIWNGTSWDPLPQQAPGPVRALAVRGDVLWAFSDDYSRPAPSGCRLHFLHDTGWTPFNEPLEGSVRKFGWAGGALYASVSDGSDTRIYRGDIGQWTLVGAKGVDRDGNLALDGSSVYRVTKDTAGIRIIEVMEGAGFKPLAPISPFVGGDLSAHQGLLYVHGVFRAPIPGGADNLAAYDGKTWNGFTRGLRPGPGASAKVLTSVGNRLYLGDEDSYWPLYPMDNRYSRIASWDGKTWDLMQHGIMGWPSVYRRGFHEVYALAAAGEEVIVAGWLDTLPDGRPAKGIARWDGKDWQPMGAGYPKRVRDIVTHQGMVYAGGENITGWPMDPAHPLYGQCLGRWNGSIWEKLGEGISGSLKKMAIHAGHLHVLGTLRIGTSTTEYPLAIWDGMAWRTPVADNYRHSFSHLASFQGSLYLTGTFIRDEHPDSYSMAGLARLEGSDLVLLDTLGPVPPAFPSSSLASDDRFLYRAAGNSVTAWDGKTVKHRLDLGVGNGVEDMVVHQGKLVLTGSILAVEGQVSAGYVIWDPASRVGIRPISDGRGKAPAPILRRMRLPGGSPFPGVVKGTRAADLKGRHLRP